MEIFAIIGIVFAILSQNFDGTPRPSSEAVSPPPTMQSGPLPENPSSIFDRRTGRANEYGQDVACRWKTDGNITKMVAIRMGTEEIHAGSIDHRTGEVTLLRQAVVAGGLILKPKNFAGEACDWGAAKMPPVGRAAIDRIILASQGLGKPSNVAGGGE